MLVAVHKIGRPTDEGHKSPVLSPPLCLNVRCSNLAQADATKKSAKRPKRTIWSNEGRNFGCGKNWPVKREVGMPAQIRIGASGLPVSSGSFGIDAVHDQNRCRDASFDREIENATRRLPANAVVVRNDREGAGQGRGSSLGGKMDNRPQRSGQCEVEIGGLSSLAERIRRPRPIPVRSRSRVPVEGDHRS